MPQRAAKVNFFTKLMQTPEGRELRRQWSKKPRKNPGRPVGVPDGMNKAMADEHHAKAKAEAKRVVEIMSEKIPELKEDEAAQEALGVAVELMRYPGAAKDRIAAARLVLEYTKQKPATKGELTLNKAEEFLSSILDNDPGAA